MVTSVADISAAIWHFYMRMQISIAFMGCRDMARPSVLWPFGE